METLQSALVLNHLEFLSTRDDSRVLNRQLPNFAEEIVSHLVCYVDPMVGIIDEVKLIEDKGRCTCL